MKTTITIESGKVTVETEERSIRKLELKPLDEPSGWRKIRDKEVESAKNRAALRPKYVEPPITPPPTGKIPNVSQREAVSSAVDARRATFMDPWNCAICCNAGDLCVLHEKLEADGKKPPKYRQYT